MCGEFIDDRLTVLLRCRTVDSTPIGRGEILASCTDQITDPVEQRENNDLAAVGKGLPQQFDCALQLGGQEWKIILDNDVRIIPFDGRRIRNAQPWMRADQLQLQRRDQRTGDRILGHRGFANVIIMPSQLLIELERQVYVDAIRQIGGNVADAALQYDWIGQLAQGLPCFTGIGEFHFEDCFVAQHPGNREVRERPKVHQGVFDGRSGHGDRAAAWDGDDGASAIGTRVLDGLGLVADDPGPFKGRDPTTRISPETIYQALFIQGHSALRRELVTCLRSGRALRVPRERRQGKGRQFVYDEIMISEHPAEVEGRAVPWHWKGDLILGLKSSAIGTLVERATRFTLLLHLPLMPDHGTGPRQKNGLDLHRFCSGQVLMLGGLTFEGHGAFPTQG